MIYIQYVKNMLLNSVRSSFLFLIKSLAGATLLQPLAKSQASTTQVRAFRVWDSSLNNKKLVIKTLRIWEQTDILKSFLELCFTSKLCHLLNFSKLRIPEHFSAKHRSLFILFEDSI